MLRRRGNCTHIQRVYAVIDPASRPDSAVSSLASLRTQVRHPSKTGVHSVMSPTLCPVFVYRAHHRKSRFVQEIGSIGLIGRTHKRRVV